VAKILKIEGQMTPNASFRLCLTIPIFPLAVIVAILPTELTAADSPNPPITGELRVSSNPHYFQDASGTPILLNGSQTWNTFPDWGTGGTIQALDFDAFVKFLTSHGHNFTLLWTAEMLASPTSLTQRSPWILRSHRFHG
jgi:hypothetical protein